MALTAEEIAAARTAFCQNREFEALRTMPKWSCFPIASASLTTIGVAANHHNLWLGLGLGGVLVVVLAWMFIVRARYMSDFEARYAENRRLLEELKRKEGGEFSSLVENQIIERRPLLEFWNRRLERRALLWRVDAFLSRKPVSE